MRVASMRVASTTGGMEEAAYEMKNAMKRIGKQEHVTNRGEGGEKGIVINGNGHKCARV